MKHLRNLCRVPYCLTSSGVMDLDESNADGASNNLAEPNTDWDANNRDESNTNGANNNLPEPTTDGGFSSPTHGNDDMDLDSSTKSTTDGANTKGEFQ